MVSAAPTVALRSRAHGRYKLAAGPHNNDARSDAKMASIPARRAFKAHAPNSPRALRPRHGAYKAMIIQYHPDKVESLGQELRDLAEMKSKEINDEISDAGARPGFSR
jgi:hypothetical protein